MSAVERMFVVDPVRHDRRGHHWHFAEGALREAAHHGFKVQFFVARSAAGRPMPGPGFHPVFRHGLYRPVTGDRGESLETDYRLGSAAFRDDLLACAPFDPGPRDLILVPTASFRNVGGLAAWRAATGNRTPLAFLFHDILPEGTTLDAGSPAVAVVRQVGAALRTAAGAAPVLVGATNPALAMQLSEAFDIDVPVLPLPHWYALEPPSDQPVYRPRDRDTVSVAFLGELRRDKGGHLLPAIAGLLRQNDDRLRLVAQAGFAEDTLMAPLQALARQGHVDLVARHLSNPEFARFIRDSPLMLLPYRRDRYVSRISGPFAFAVAAARPCIVPDGTWMSGEIEAGRAAGIAYAGDTAEAIADAIVRAVDNLPALGAEATERAAAWRKSDGSAMISCLTNWAAGTNVQS